MYHWPSSMRRLDNDLRLSHAVRICSFFSFFFILSNTRSEFSFSPNYSVFKQFLAVQYFLKWIETWAHLWQGMEKLLFNSHSRVVPFPEVHKVSLVRTRCGEKRPFWSFILLHGPQSAFELGHWPGINSLSYVPTKYINRKSPSEKKSVWLKSTRKFWDPDQWPLGVKELSQQKVVTTTCKRVHLLTFSEL